jgi:hypothetical protein
MSSFVNATASSSSNSTSLSLVQRLGSPISLTEKAALVNYPNGFTRRHRWAQGRRLRHEFVHQANEQLKMDYMKRRREAHPIQFKEKNLPPIKPRRTTNKPRFIPPLHDQIVDSLCYCPNDCHHHVGNNSNNPIYIDLEDTTPRVTTAQRKQTPLVLVPPTINYNDNTVNTNLAAIVAIRQWYEELERQVLEQLGLNPFNYDKDMDKLQATIDVEMTQRPPTDI